MNSLQVDITALPRTHVLKEFAEYTTDPDEKAKLLLMTSNTDEGREMYNGFIGKYFLHDFNFILFIKTNCEIRKKYNTNIFKTQLKSFIVPNQGNLLFGVLTRKPLEEREFIFVYLCSLQNCSLFIKKYFLNYGQHCL